MNDNLLGRIAALALILGAVYGVTAISRGGLACPLGRPSCCALPAEREEGGRAPESAKAAAAKPADGGDEDRTLQKKAPVVPPAEADSDD